MAQTTRCPICGKRMVPVVTLCGRTDLQCISCDDPAVKWAESPLTAPEKPNVAEPAGFALRGFKKFLVNLVLATPQAFSL